MEIEIFRTNSQPYDYTDVQIKDGNGNIYCVRFGDLNQIIHTKLHYNVSTSYLPGTEVDEVSLEKFLASKGSSISALVQQISSI